MPDWRASRLVEPELPLPECFSAVPVAQRDEVSAVAPVRRECSAEPG